MPTLAICIDDEQMIVNHRARVWVDPSRHPQVLTISPYFFAELGWK